MQSKTLLLALLALVASAVARPGGAPACAINEQRIQAGMGEPAGDRSFRLEASATEYTPGQPLTMKVTSTNAATRTYKGILLYVQPAAAANQRVGTFTIPQGHKDNTGPCAGANIQAIANSVLTQSSSDDKPLGGDIVWTPPADATGDMTVRAVIVGAGPKNWQVLENVTLKRRGGGGEQPAQGGNNGGQRRVCKKWRKVQPGAGGNNNNNAPSPTQPAGQQGPGQGPTGNETPAPAPPADGSAPAPAPPADGQAPPAPPAEGQAPPADGQAPPAPPADGQAPPAPPADGQAPPADGQAPPAPPADGQAPAGDGQAPPVDGQAAAGQVQENNTASSASGMHKSVASGLAAAVVAVAAMAF